MVEIPESHRRLLEDKVFAMLGTVMPDGQPQVHPVWVDYDGQYVRVNTARGRQKDENLQRHPQATVLLIDTRSPYFWIEIRGRVVERIEGEEAEAHTGWNTDAERNGVLELIARARAEFERRREGVASKLR